jgi:hypothetical protein
MIFRSGANRNALEWLSGFARWPMPRSVLIGPAAAAKAIWRRCSQALPLAGSSMMLT